MRAFFAFVLTLLGLGALALYASAFIVHQNEQALVLRFGKEQQVITAPGLQWKVPFVDTVDYFDKRILDLDTSEQEVTASDQQRLIVDAYARYRITDVLKFYQNVRFEERVRQVVGPLVEFGNPPRSWLRDVAGYRQEQARKPDEADRGAGEQGRPRLRS